MNIINPFLFQVERISEIAVSVLFGIIASFSFSLVCILKKKCNPINRRDINLDSVSDISEGERDDETEMNTPPIANSTNSTTLADTTQEDASCNLLADTTEEGASCILSIDSATTLPDTNQEEGSTNLSTSSEDLESSLLNSRNPFNYSSTPNSHMPIPHLNIQMADLSEISLLDTPQDNSRSVRQSTRHNNISYKHMFK